MAKKPNAMKRVAKAQPKKPSKKTDAQRMKLLGSGGAKKAGSAIMKRNAALKKALSS